MIILAILKQCLGGFGLLNKTGQLKMSPQTERKCNGHFSLFSGTFLDKPLMDPSRKFISR